jgi:hypothetical protein
VTDVDWGTALILSIRINQTHSIHKGNVTYIFFLGEGDGVTGVETIC